MQMVMTSDETQIQTFANWPMSHTKRVTRDNRKNPEYHNIVAIVVAIVQLLRVYHAGPVYKTRTNVLGLFLIFDQTTMAQERKYLRTVAFPLESLCSTFYKVK